ncbi:MAG: GNAT family N-acetyltransferase [Gammaproteobacteria bacterium]
MQRTNEFNQPIGHSVENWSPRDRPSPHVVLRGQYCILAPMNIEKHGPGLFQSLITDNDGSSWTYLPYGPCLTLASLQDWLEIVLAEKDVLLYAIIDARTQVPVGVSGYLRITPNDGLIEVGHLHFSKLLQKTPAATEAMFLMMQHAFDDLKYRRYEWKCDSLNQPSRNAALRLGFTFEGIFRQHMVRKDRNRDTAWFSILDSEWPALKEKFVSWLHPDNFDEEGKQRVSLNSLVGAKIALDDMRYNDER